MFFNSTSSTIAKGSGSWSSSQSIFTDADAKNYNVFLLELTLGSSNDAYQTMCILGNYMDNIRASYVPFDFIYTYNNSSSPVIGKGCLFIMVDQTTGEMRAYVNESTSFGTYSYKLSSSGGFTAQGYDTTADFTVKITGVVGLC